MLSHKAHAQQQTLSVHVIVTTPHWTHCRHTAASELYRYCADFQSSRTLIHDSYNRVIYLQTSLVDYWCRDNNTI